MRVHLEGAARGRRRSERGAAIVVVLMGLTTMAGLSLAMLQFGASVRRGHQLRLDDERATYLAEAGVAEAIVALSDGGSGGVGSSVQPARFGDGLFWVTAEDLGDYRTRLLVQAMCESGRAAVEAVLRTPPAVQFPYGVFSEESLVIDSGAHVDSFDSSLPTTYDQQRSAGQNQRGTVGSNGDISLLGSSHVYGDASPGPTGTVYENFPNSVTGSNTPMTEPVELEPVAAPAIPRTEYPAGSGGSLVFAERHSPLVLPAGEYNLEGIDVEGGGLLTIQGPAKVVVDDLTMSSNSGLVFDTSTGPIEVFLSGDFDAPSNAFVGTPADSAPDVSFVLTGGTSQHIEFSPNSEFRGTIYGPEASIVIKSNFELFGAVAGRDVHIDANADVHFDLAVLERFAGAGEVQVETWSRAPFTDRRYTANRGDPFQLLDVDRDDLSRPSSSTTPRTSDPAFLDLVMAPHPTHRLALVLLWAALAAGLCSASPTQTRSDVVHERIHAVLANVDEDATEAPVGLAGQLARLGVEALPGLFDCLATGHTAVDEPLAITPGRRMLVLATFERLPRSSVRAHLVERGAPPAPARATAAALEVFGVVGSVRDLETMIGLALPAREESVEYRSASALERAITRLLKRDGSAVQALAVHLATTDERLWMWLVRPLSRAEDPGSLLALSSLLGRVPSKDPLVLGAMAKAAPSAQRPLEQAVVWKVVGITEQGDPALASAAATCLGRLEAHEAVPALIELLVQEDAEVAESAHWALRRLAGVNLGRDAEHWSAWYDGELEWWESEGAPLCARLHGAEPHEIYRLLGDLAGRRVLRHVAVDPLLTLLEHAEPQVRATACRVLDGIRSPESRAGLEASLLDPAPEVRLAARKALETPTDRENER